MKAILELMESGRFDLARVELRRAIARSPDDPEVALLIARCLEGRGSWTEARHHYADLHRRGTPSIAIAAGLARAQAETGAPAEALELLAGLDPAAADEPVLAAARARALTALGDATGARSTVAEAAARHPGDPELLRAAWRLAVLTGDDDELVSAWSEAAHDPVAAGELVGPVCDRCLGAERPDLAVELLGRADTLHVDLVSVPAVARVLVRFVSSGPDAETAMRELVAALGGLDPTTWTYLVRGLIELGTVRLARMLTTVLSGSDNVQHRKAVARLAPVLASLPEDPSLPPDVERGFEQTAPVWVPKPGGLATVVVFTRKAFTARLIHEALAARSVHILYLRENIDLPSLVETDPGEAPLRYTEMLDLIRSRVDERGGPLLTIGTSGAGYAALLYGIDLGAHAVLALAPPTRLDEEVVRMDPRAAVRAAELRRNAPELAVDLRLRLERASHPPRIAIHYGAESPFDVLHAEHLAGLPRVRLVPRPAEGRHSLLPAMVADGTFAEALDAMLAHTPVPAQPAAG